MKLKNLVTTLAVTAGLSMGSVAFAATGGGATIHNAATLTYGAGGLKITAKVDVLVKTIPTAPAFEILTSSPITTAAGETVTINYRISSNANGKDEYNFTGVNANPNGIDDISNPVFNPSNVQLNASVTTIPSTNGKVYIPAGSEGTFAVGDIVRVKNNGQDEYFKVTAIAVGTPADTNLGTHITADEVYTILDLDPANAGGTNAYLGNSDPITNGSIPAGSQIGQVKDFTLTFVAGAPTTPGTDGSYDIEITGNTDGTDDSGNNVPFDSTTNVVGPNTSVVTVVSGAVALTKEACNLTTSGSCAWNNDADWQVNGVAVKTGHILMYRITALANAGQDVTGAKLSDNLSPYVTYQAGTTQLNGVAVADGIATAAGIDVQGINSANLGDIDEDDKAVVTFEVIVK